MKILFVSSWYPNSSNPSEGIFIAEHAKAIHSAGNEVVVLTLGVRRANCFFKKKTNIYVDENGISIYQINLQTRFRDVIYHAVPLHTFLIKRIFQRIIGKNFRPDIVHSHVIFPAGIIGHQLAKSLNKPHIITEHWSRLGSFIQKPIISGWGINAYLHAKYILPVSHFLKRNILACVPKLSADKLLTIGNVVDSSMFYYKRDENRADNIIQCCATAIWAHKKTPDKLPELFIRALGAVQRRSEKQIVLTLIGGGDRLPELETLCRKNNVLVKTTGTVGKEVIAKKLQASDFFLHASTIETFGVGVAEALMCGVPVVCSAVGALPEIVNNTNGVLCKNSVDDWITGIERAFSTHYDRKRIAESNIDRFSVHAVGKAISAVYFKTTEN